MIDSKGGHQSIKVEDNINDASHYFPTYEQSQTGHWKMETALNEKYDIVHIWRAISAHEFINMSNCYLNKRGEYLWCSLINSSRTTNQSQSDFKLDLN